MRYFISFSDVTIPCGFITVLRDSAWFGFLADVCVGEAGYSLGTLGLTNLTLYELCLVFWRLTLISPSSSFY